MTTLHFRVWHLKELKMYYRGYQKLTHVLLCDDDQGMNNGRGIPVKQESYHWCDFMQTTGLRDINEHEIYEGDIIEVVTASCRYKGTLGTVPDMYKSRNLHPLQSIFAEFNIDEKEVVSLKIIGHKYQSVTQPFPCGKAPGQG